jgi:hypothetical protein
VTEGPLSFEDIKTFSLAQRHSKVHRELFARPWDKGGSFSRFLESMPHILAGSDFMSIVQRVAEAHRNGRIVILAMGAHPIKVGLNPVIIDLMDKGLIRGVAMNGACVIHDTEVALLGQTSEDVEGSLGHGSFGMAEETAVFINQAVKEGYSRSMGLGRSVGEAILQKNPPYVQDSILAAAARLDVPATIHVAIGTDIIHFHPSCDGAAMGGASHLDFRIFCRMVAGLEGGVLIHLGSAVILPEVFLKALTVVRNLGHQVAEFTTVNMDFIKHYRPLTNVVHRPTMEGGTGYHLTGHHEIMFPLLAAAIIEQMERT